MDGIQEDKRPDFLGDSADCRRRFIHPIHFLQTVADIPVLAAARS